MGSTLEYQLTSQLEQLCESAQTAGEARLLFWRETSFLVLIQIYSCFLQTFFEKGKEGPRGTVRESKYQPSMALS